MARIRGARTCSERGRPTGGGRARDPVPGQRRGELRDRLRVRRRRRDDGDMSGDGRWSRAAPPASGAPTVARLRADGYRVAALDRDAAALDGGATPTSAASRTSPTPTACTRPSRSAVAELGGLDVVVASAGIAGAGTVVDTPLEDWDAIFAINVRGMYLTGAADDPAPGGGRRRVVRRHRLAARDGRRAGVGGVLRVEGRRRSTSCAPWPSTTRPSRRARQLRLPRADRHAAARALLRRHARPGGHARRLRSRCRCTAAWSSPEEIADAIAYLASPRRRAPRRATRSSWTAATSSGTEGGRSVIVRPIDGEQAELVMQVDHADGRRRPGRRVGRARRRRARAREAEVRLAARLHDIGWRSWEAAPEP